MTRTVSTSGFMLYPQSDGSQAAQVAQSSDAPSGGISTGQGLLQEYGGLAKTALAPSSTSIAEGYNQVYDWATGWNAKAVPGTNLATGTSSSGTFGGSNLANAAYGYAGGKLANEIFDNKGYSDLGGSTGAVVGASVAAGSSAIGVSMGATYGAWAGPIGALAGAVLGAAIGSLFGSSGISDSSFRTYSGDMGDEVSDFNKQRTSEEGFDSNGRNGYFQQEAGLPYNTGLITFAYGQDLSTGVLGNSIASTETPFGKYTVALVDDMKNEDELSFSEAWVDRVNKVDTAFSKLFTAEEIAKAKEGMSGTAQASHEWEKKSQANVATADMLIDRYVRIAQIAGREDIRIALLDTAKGKDGRVNGGVDTIGAVIKQFSPEQPTTQPVAQRTARISPSQSAQPQRRRISISRPEGVINPAMELNYV